MHKQWDVEVHWFKFSAPKRRCRLVNRFLFFFPNSLAFSVTLFCSTAMLALIVMMMRRSKMIGGELGGPRGYKLATSTLFVFLWLFYVLMSSLEAYGYIQGKIWLDQSSLDLARMRQYNSFSSIRFLNRSTRNTHKRRPYITRHINKTQKKKSPRIDPYVLFFLFRSLDLIGLHNISSNSQIDSQQLIYNSTAILRACAVLFN